MSDTVTKLMRMVDEYAHWNRWTSESQTKAARQALQDELVRLFTPLTDEQIEKMAMEEVGLIIDDDSPFSDSDIMKVFELVRGTEAKHGITGVKNEHR